MLAISKCVHCDLDPMLCVGLARDDVRLARNASEAIQAFSMHLASAPSLPSFPMMPCATQTHSGSGAPGRSCCNAVSWRSDRPATGKVRRMKKKSCETQTAWQCLSSASEKVILTPRAPTILCFSATAVRLPQHLSGQ